MTKNIYTTYASDTDMTFIMEETYDEDRLVKIEVKGFYFGRPNNSDTKEFTGSLNAEF